MAHIELRHITKTFRRHTALKDLSLDVGDGEFFVLLGPTGAGKTTTLRLIAGLDAPDSGSILIESEDVGQWSAAERDVALVFQYYSLYPHYTVRQNLEFPLKSRQRRLAADEIARRVADAARILRIEHLLERKTDRLSGGEMQRVSLGRAIVRKPRIFLMDEPLSNLDAKLREILRAELKDLQMRFRATFLYVTHDQVEAMSMGDKIGVLNQGRIVQIGTPHEVYNHPHDTFVATFVGSPAMNLLPAALGDGKVTVVPGKLEMAVAPDVTGRLPSGLERVTLGVRAEDVVLGPDGGASGRPNGGRGGTLEGRVYGVENHGAEKIVTLEVDQHTLKATAPAHMAIEVGSVIQFAIDPAKLRFFEPQTGLNLAR